MKIKVKQPAAVQLTLDEQELVVQQTVKHGLKRSSVVTTVPRTALIGMEMHQPTEDNNGHFQVTYQLDKKADKQIVDFWFGRSDAPFLNELHQILEQQINKNSEWGEADFVANGQLIMEYLDMRDKGLLTNAEFEAKKREILRLD
ncbi:SHOCT domain-containing protein [Loigolactobacillus zhaoyuanensis]|uniref:SHOCT domain-containing protein n=1 Tax=Loigolactobacillus zhaoyuanensis TaxID=2486017 RepID=UPI000F738561|nr:SHOCT domain-containing protein [Loigolactobacillus zhaoyuanensis]